ncbi:mechanosensitive ion channel [Temperatibacter marinus]|uniref:Mechanosensitive ion channel n=1 Tax=Temperatibacter marinus TaxID=1456591 RepID=A0AA52EEC1_9PROT|nr:mechanosensitive ion channel domain-containing protein [Temperatibacter marinus]WND01518.1 mechanosensitive ion channel [Temperatibacter marinus]
MEAKFLEIWTQLQSWVSDYITGWHALIEISVVILSLLLGQFVAKWLRSKINLLVEESDRLAKIERTLAVPILQSAFALILVWTGYIGLKTYYEKLIILDITTSLLTAWFVIRLVAGVIANREIARMVAPIIWIGAALNILGLLDPLLEVLEGAKIPLGESSISALDVISGVFSLALFMWGALFVASLLEKRLRSMASVPASARVLITKTSRIILIIIAFLLALNATGIDLTALAVFGGALGVGIGFGLQKVVGNFISGLILLMDRSIKPGDVVETGGTYGIISKLAARYTSVVTRDGTEYLIPNEDMITQPVINWSHTDTYVRRKISVLIAYEDDPRQAMDLMIAAALEDPRVVRIESKKPQCRLMDFADSGIQIQLRFWITDAESGVNNVASNVRLAIWDKFKEAGIHFPYPHHVIKMEKESSE